MSSFSDEVVIETIIKDSVVVETVTSEVVVTEPTQQTVVELYEDSFDIEILTGVRGPQGRTIELFSGPVAPSENIGETGDLYIIKSSNAANGDLYQKADDGWGFPISKFSGPIESINGRFDTHIVLDKTDVGLGNVTNDAQVTVATTQTITGSKTFSASVSMVQPFIKPSSDHGYISFFSRDDTPTTRTAWVGVGSAGSNIFTIRNEMTDGGINLTPSTNAAVTVTTGAFTVTSGVITGNGSGLTSLNASNLSSGTIGDARLSTNVSLLNAAQTITGAKTFNATTIFGGSGYGLGEDTFFAWDNNHNNRFGFSKKSGAQPKLAYANTNFAITQYVGQTNINPAGAGTQTDRLIIDTNGAVSIPGTVTSTGGFSGPGGSLTGLNGSNISTGTVADARLSTNVVLLDNTQTISGVKTFSADTYISRLRSSTQITSVTSGTLGSAVGDAVLTRRHSHTGATNDMQMIDMVSRRATTPADWTTTNFYQGIGVDSSFLLSPLLGTGSRLRTWMGRDPQNQQIFFGSEGTTYLTLSSTAITASGTIAFTGNGSGLTSLSGTNISSGTVADARLSSNVALLDAAQTFTGAKTFSAASTFSARTIVSSADTGTTYTTAPFEIRQTSTGVPRISFHKSGVNAAQIRMTDAGVFEFANIGDTALSSISALNITSTGTISGNGSGITSLSGSNISSGTVADARLSTNVVLLNSAQTITGAKTFNSDITMAGSDIAFTTTGSASPSFTTTSAGTRIILYPELSADAANYAIGVEPYYMWYGAATATTGHKWYSGTTNTMILTGDGTLTANTFSGSGSGLTGIPTGAINNLAITDAKVATANKDGDAATPSMRTLGTGALQAAAGSHLHDDRYYTEAEATGLFVPKLGPTVTGNTRRAIDLVSWGEGTNGGTGDIIIQTNLDFSNIMMTLNIKGYMYAAGQDSIVDLQVGFYAYNSGGTPSFVNHSAVNKGNFPFTSVRLMRRTSDSKVAIVLTSGLPASAWYYPKLTVDALFGHTAPTDAQLQGWTITRGATTALTAMSTTTVDQSLFTSDQRSNVVGSHYGYKQSDTNLPNDMVTRTCHLVTSIGTVPSNATTAHVTIEMSAHAAANAAVFWEPQFSSNNGATSWQFMGQHYSHNQTNTAVNLGFTSTLVFDVWGQRGALVALAVNGRNDTGSGAWIHVGFFHYSIVFMT